MKITSERGAGRQVCTTVSPGTTWKWRTCLLLLRSRVAGRSLRSADPRKRWSHTGQPDRPQCAPPSWLSRRLIDERLPPLPSFFCSCALDAVRQLPMVHHGEADLDFSVAGFELFQYLPNGVAPPLPGDHNGRVED